MDNFKTKLVGGIALAYLAILAANCGLSNGRFRSCMRTEFHFTLGYVFQFGCVLLGIWIGRATALSSKKEWLGWVVGIGTWLLTGFFFMWLGFDLPDNYDY